jgi:hypothetical protein
MTVKDRWDWKKSSIYTQILNKNWTFIKWKLEWIEFFDFDLDLYLKWKYEAYLKDKKRKEKE